MQADIALTRKLTDKDDPEQGSPEAKAYARWIGNYSTPPAGWPRPATRRPASAVA